MGKVFIALGTLIREVTESFLEKRLLTHSAAMAYYSSLSLAPIIVLVMTAISFLDYNNINQISSLLTMHLGPQAAQIFQLVSEKVQVPKTTLSLASLGSFLILILSASFVFSQLQGTLNFIFGIKPRSTKRETRKRDTFLNFSIERLFSLGFVIGFILFTTVSMVAATLVTHVLSGFLLAITESVSFLFTWLMFSGIFTIVLRWVPYKTIIGWKNCALGGLFIGTLFTLGNGLISKIIGSTSMGSAYGAAGTLFVFLVWIYYSSIIVFLGAVAIKEYQRLFKSR